MNRHGPQGGEADKGRAGELLLEELKEAVGEDAVRDSDLDVEAALASRPRSVRRPLCLRVYSCSSPAQRCSRPG
jgi:hypothetical protein